MSYPSFSGRTGIQSVAFALGPMDSRFRGKDRRTHQVEEPLMAILAPSMNIERIGLGAGGALVCRPLSD